MDILISLIVFISALFLVIKGATVSTKYAGSLAENLRLSKYTVGFIIVAVISILPEAFISIDAAIRGIPSFGLGMLLGSNIADLALVPAILVFAAGRNLKVEHKILKNRTVYPLFLLLPLVLGFDGYYSRLEGAALILAGAIFYYLSLKTDTDATVPREKRIGMGRHVIYLLFGMMMLLFGSYLTVESAVKIASVLNISPVLIGMLVVGLGTTMPELFFSLKCVRKVFSDDSLAIGDILGTVLADATIVVGILALINPFAFSKMVIYVTGLFMVGAAFVLFSFLRSGQKLTKREAYLLVGYWMIFVIVEYLLGR